MALRLKQTDRNTPLLLPPDLRDWVGEDDLVHFVIQAVERLPLTTFALNHKGSGDEQYPIPAKVDQTLKLDAEENHEEIRAAAHILVQLGVTYVWPVDLIDCHCQLAAQKLEQLKAMDVYSGSDFQKAIQEEIDILKSRLSKTRLPENFENNG